MEIQRELIANQQKSKFFESSILMAKKNIERSKITIKEIESLGESNKTYFSLGKKNYFI